MASRQQTKLIDHWKSKGYFVINLVVTSKSGLPDLICLKPDKVVFCESKEKWDKLSDLQKIWFRKLNRMGFDTYLNENLFVPEVEKTNLF